MAGLELFVIVAAGLAVSNAYCALAWRNLIIERHRERERAEERIRNLEIERDRERERADRAVDNLVVSKRIGVPPISEQFLKQQAARIEEEERRLASTHEAFLDADGLIEEADD